MENFIESAFDTLPTETLLDILLKLDFEDAIKLCEAYSHLELCKDDILALEFLKRDYPDHLHIGDLTEHYRKIRAGKGESYMFEEGYTKNKFITIPGNKYPSGTQMYVVNIDISINLVDQREALNKNYSTFSVTKFNNRWLEFILETIQDIYELYVPENNKFTSLHNIRSANFVQNYENLDNTIDLISNDLNERKLKRKNKIIIKFLFSIFTGEQIIFTIDVLKITLP